MPFSTSNNNSEKRCGTEEEEEKACRLRPTIDGICGNLKLHYNVLESTVIGLLDYAMVLALLLMMMIMIVLLVVVDMR